MNTTAKTSLRLTASALAVAAGLAISTFSGAALAQQATGIAQQHIDVVRAPVTRRGGAPEPGAPADFGLSSERLIEVAYAPVTRRGGAPEPGAPADFGLSAEQVIVVRAPLVTRGGGPSTGVGVIGLTAGN